MESLEEVEGEPTHRVEDAVETGPEEPMRLTQAEMEELDNQGFLEPMDQMVTQQPRTIPQQPSRREIQQHQQRARELEQEARRQAEERENRMWAGWNQAMREMGFPAETDQARAHANFQTTPLAIRHPSSSIRPYQSMTPATQGELQGLEYSVMTLMNQTLQMNSMIPPEGNEDLTRDRHIGVTIEIGMREGSRETTGMVLTRIIFQVGQEEEGTLETTRRLEMSMNADLVRHQGESTTAQWSGTSVDRVTNHRQPGTQTTGTAQAPERDGPARSQRIGGSAMFRPIREADTPQAP